MFGADFINTVMNFTEEVDPFDANAAARRLRILQLLQETHDDVWHSREWQFTYARSTATLAAGSIAIPATFLELGQSGGIWLPNRKTKLVEAFPAEVIEARETGQSGLANRFSIIGGVIYTDSTTATDSLVIWHREVPPTLVDDDSTPLTIPAAYHHSVLLQGTIAKARQSKGDVRDWISKYQEGLAKMIATERRRKTTTQFMPMAVNNW